MACATLPLLALVWINAAAAPCIGMAGAVGALNAPHHDHPGPGREASSSVYDHRSFSHEQHIPPEHEPSVPTYGQRPPVQEQHAPTHEHHAPMHEQHAPAHEQHAPTQDDVDCTHCPLTAPAAECTPNAAHIACDTVESVADNGRGAFAKGGLKHVLPPSSLQSPAHVESPTGLFRPTVYERSVSPPLPLNVRYCVFLI